MGLIVCDDFGGGLMLGDVFLMWLFGFRFILLVILFCCVCNICGIVFCLWSFFMLVWVVIFDFDLMLVDLFVVIIECIWYVLD